MKPESNMCSAWEMHVMVNKGDHISLIRMLQAVNKNVIGTITNKKFKNETLLSTAIKCGHNNIAKLLLKHGADPNQRSFENGRNEPPLITATRFKNLELVKLLLENDANISKTGFYGYF
jgi:ankyrin repeat protein